MSVIFFRKQQWVVEMHKDTQNNIQFSLRNRANNSSDIYITFKNNTFIVDGEYKDPTLRKSSDLPTFTFLSECISKHYPECLI